MGVIPDYGAAATMHFRDGEYLLTDHRERNADQLFGLSAECGLKAILLGLVTCRNAPLTLPEVRAGGLWLDYLNAALKVRDRQPHVDVLWAEYDQVVSGLSPAGTGSSHAARPRSTIGT